MKDVDFLQCEITVREGNGFKERVTVLPALLAALRPLKELAPLRPHVVERQLQQGTHAELEARILDEEAR